MVSLRQIRFCKNAFYLNENSMENRQNNVYTYVKNEFVPIFIGALYTWLLSSEL